MVYAVIRKTTYDTAWKAGMTIFNTNFIKQRNVRRRETKEEPKVPTKDPRLAQTIEEGFRWKNRVDRELTFYR